MKTFLPPEPIPDTDVHALVYVTAVVLKLISINEGYIIT